MILSLQATQKAIIDIEIPDHQLIFCNRKTLKTKTGSHKQISFCSLKNYSVVAYEEALKKVRFPNYESFININEVYSKVTSVVDEIAPCKTKREKENSQDWFDSVVSEWINNRDKRFKKFKKSTLPLGQGNYKKVHYEVKKLIAEKKGATFKQSLPKTLANQKSRGKP